MTILAHILIILTIILLAISLIYSHLNLFYKTAAILSTAAFLFAQIFVIYQTKGTPLDIALPDEFLVSHTIVREPNLKIQDSGAVFYVVIETDQRPASVRLYQQPYTKAEHRRAQELQDAINNAKGPVLAKKAVQTNSSMESRILDKMTGSLLSNNDQLSDADHDSFIIDQQPSILPAK